MAEITRETVAEIFYPSKLKRDETPKDFSLPIRWDGGDFYKELYSLFQEYMRRIKNRIPEDEYWEHGIGSGIERICRLICQAVSETFQGNPSIAYNAVAKVLTHLTANNEDIPNSESLGFISESEFGKLDLYRVVDVHDKAKHDRKRVFHVPFNMRSKMSTTRYSIPGYPALYLGTSIELDCMEIGKTSHDDTVMAASFEFCGNKIETTDVTERGFIKEQVNILDLCVKPQDFRIGWNDSEQSDASGRMTERQKLLGKVDGDICQYDFLKFPKYYLLWYPLIAACSYIRSYRNDPFSPEYIIPQLVTQWIKNEKSNRKMENTELRDSSLNANHVLYGVGYFSCQSEQASEMGLNFAIPSSGNDIWMAEEWKNYCPFLAANFKLTEPKFVSEYRNASSCADALKDEILNKKERIGRFTGKLKIWNRYGEYRIPEGEYYIPDYTFAQSEKLKEIFIPDSVTRIGHYAFYECCNLQKAEIPPSVARIGDYAFSRCTGMTKLKMEYGLTTIGHFAFEGCFGLPEATIPNSVTSIGGFAFAECTGLTKVTIPNSVTSIGEYAFASCGGLPEVMIPTSVMSIGAGTFRECTGLTEVTIPSSVTSIGRKAFAGCENLNIRVPSRFRDLNNGAFDGCKSVTYYEA